ncbi:MAG: hypothetical protein KAS73_08675 [Candidatus Sabulitectum sp.]|nr:hypothetical protein [Candidatus Sabulitectum sp.]
MKRYRYAVLTGDINASSRMGKREAKNLEKILRASFQELVANRHDIEADHFTCFRGDSWQFVVGDATAAASAALYFRASLIIQSYDAFGIRLNSSVSIGFGSIDFFPDSESSAGGGKAYELSGKRLDKIRKRLPGMSVSGLGPPDPGVSAMLGVIDALVRHWTPSRARAVCLSLQSLTQIEIASKWEPEPISQQAVHKHLQSAGWPAIEPALNWIATTIKGCIAKNNLGNQIKWKSSS